MKKLPIKLALVLTLMTAGCKDGFEELNKPWDKAVTAPVDQLYNGIVSTFVLGWQEQATYHSWIYPVTQQAIVTSASGYVMNNAASELWSNYYLCLGNFRLLEKKIEESPDKDKYRNLQAMAKTLMAYKTLKMTGFFGDMPYSEAGRAATEGYTKYRAKYDTQADIMKTAMTELKWAVDNFSTGADQISVGAAETFLKGDIGQWTRFANSLRLRCALNISGKDKTTAAAVVTECLAKPLLADGENIGIWPKSLGLTLGGRRWSFNAGFFHRMGTTMWSWMTTTDAKDGSGIIDPRCRIFFEPNNAGEWAPYPQNPTNTTPVEGGQPYNDVRLTSWATKGATNIYSPINYYFAQDQTTIPELMITAAEVHLLKAEAYVSGIGVTKNTTTAKDEYEKGVTASVNFWTKVAMDSPEWVVAKPTALPAPAVIAALLKAPKVAFDASTDEKALRQIYAQLWIDGFRQPWDVWTLKRRTGNMTPMSETNTAYYDANFAVYHRFTFPSSEPDYNNANWRAATGGTDVVGTKTWLEK